MVIYCITFYTHFHNLCRDMENLANILASTEDHSAVPKMLIFKDDICTMHYILLSEQPSEA